MVREHVSHLRAEPLLLAIGIQVRASVDVPVPVDVVAQVPRGRIGMRLHHGMLDSTKEGVPRLRNPFVVSDRVA